MRSLAQNLACMELVSPLLTLLLLGVAEQSEAALSSDKEKAPVRFITMLSSLSLHICIFI